MKNDKPKYKLVLIKWVDSMMGISKWTEISTLDTKPAIAYSVGWLVKDSNDYIMIAAHLATDGEGNNEDGYGIMTIPKGCIKKTTTLKTR